MVTSKAARLYFVSFHLTCVILILKYVVYWQKHYLLFIVGETLKIYHNFALLQHICGVYHRSVHAPVQMFS